MPRHRAHQLLRLINWVRFIERFWGLRGKNKRRRVLVRLARAVLSRVLHRWNWHRWGNTFQCDPIRTLFEWLKWQKLFELRISLKLGWWSPFRNRVLCLLYECRSRQDRKLQNQINAMAGQLRSQKDFWHRWKKFRPAGQQSGDKRRLDQPI